MNKIQKPGNATRISAIIILTAIVLVGGLFILARSVFAPSNRAIHTFEECKKAGNKVQESYPEVCVTDDGQSFVNPSQVVE